MELAVVKDAVQQLESRGIRLSQITAPLIREILGFGSYTSIIAHLRTLRGEVPASSEAPEDGPSTCKETAVALFDDTPVDLVQAAEDALQRAKERLAQAEARVPALERQLAELRHALLQATLEHLTVGYAASKGLLSTSDPGVADSEKAMWLAGRAHREAKEQLEQMPRDIAAAKAGIRLAQQQLHLAQHHPELVRALAEAEGLRPTEDRGPDSYRQWAIWRQEVSSARSACDAVIREAGL
jgi:chromosome segregation ATPase